MARGFFVTGTDTGVGKTLVACALLYAFSRAGKSVVGMKPVAAGREGDRFADVEALARASSVRADSRMVNPYAFEPAIAPHIAAQLAGVAIELEPIVRAYAELSQRAEVVVVEGAGGFLVPLNARETGADLAARLGLPMVLVVGMRLGCLNHALLTRRQIEASGLRCAGWVANCILPDMPHLDDNIRALEERLGCPLLGVVPFLREPTPAGVAALLSFDSLIEAVA
ncbi:MAG TPA: dethiobiotin synthase [Burkholderiales bacterium]|nr:dethiobiotin synthase [Burkholderiales bacterium]